MNILESPSSYINKRSEYKETKPYIRDVIAKHDWDMLLYIYHYSWKGRSLLTCTEYLLSIIREGRRDIAKILLARGKFSFASKDIDKYIFDSDTELVLLLISHIQDRQVILSIIEMAETFERSNIVDFFINKDQSLLIEIFEQSKATFASILSRLSIDYGTLSRQMYESGYHDAARIIRHNHH